MTNYQDLDQESKGYTLPNVILQLKKLRESILKLKFSLLIGNLTEKPLKDLSKYATIVLSLFMLTTMEIASVVELPTVPFAL